MGWTLLLASVSFLVIVALLNGSDAFGRHFDKLPEKVQLGIVIASMPIFAAAWGVVALAAWSVLARLGVNLACPPIFSC